MKTQDRLDILEDIEKKANGYAVINILSNIFTHMVGFYLIVELFTYMWRQLNGH